jgi:hypothetical protein
MKHLNKNNSTAKALPVFAAASVGLLLCAAPSRASLTLYNISVPTDALNANVAGSPYSLFFQLADGSGTGDGNNTATISDFNVSGPISPIELTDNTPFATDQEPFTPNASPNSLLTFTLSISNNADVGSNPDEFSFYILDNFSNPLTTTDPTSADSLVTIDLGGFSPSVTTYEGTGTYSDVDPNVSLATPEPSPLISLTSAFLGLGFLIALRRRESSSEH